MYDVEDLRNKLNNKVTRYRCTKSLTMTSTIEVEKDLIESKLQSERKNDNSSNEDFEYIYNNASSRNAATKRTDSRRYSEYQRYQDNYSQACTPPRDIMNDHKYRKRTPVRYRDKYYCRENRPSYSPIDDRCTENETSDSTYGKFDSDTETSSSDLRYKVEDKRDRFDGSSPLPRYESRHHSPPYKSSRYNFGKKSSRLSRSPSYDDRRSRSVGRSHHVNGEKDRKTDGNRYEHKKHNTRDIYSDPWRKQDRHSAVSDNKQLESDTKDLLANLLRTTMRSVISKPTSSNDKHTSLNLKKTDKPTSTVTSNEQSSNHLNCYNEIDDDIINQIVAKSNHLRNGAADIINEKTSTNFHHEIDDEIINRIVAKSTNISDKASNVARPVTFDHGAFKPVIANFKNEENADFIHNSEADTGTQENSRPDFPLSQFSSRTVSDIQPVPGYKQIPKPLPQSKPKASILPQCIQSTTRSGLMQPPTATSTTKKVQCLNWNQNLQPHQTGVLRDRRPSLSSNSLNSSPKEHYQASPYAWYNQNASINARRSTAYYQSNKAPMIYGEHTPLRASAPSTSGNVQYKEAMKPSNIVDGTSNSNLGARSSDNISMSIPKVNFKIPKVPTKTIQIIDDRDVTPESVKKHLNEGGNAVPERNVKKKIINSEDDKEPKSRANHSTEQESPTKSSSVDSPFTQVNAETILKGVNTSNELLLLINIMGRLSEGNTLAKVKEILQNDANGESVSNQELSANAVANVENIDVAKTSSKKRRHKNELDSFNDDADAVLSANDGPGAASVAKFVDSTSADDVCNEQSKTESTPPKLDLDIPKESVALQTNKVPKLLIKLAEPVKKRKASKETVKSIKKRIFDLNIPNEHFAETTSLQSPKPTKKVPKLVIKLSEAVKKSRDASKESDKSTKKRMISSELKNSSVKSKRLRDIVKDVEEPTPKKTSVAQKRVVKNNNVELHSLKKVVGCQLCDKACGLSLVNHYVNFHPNSEVFTSRLSPEAVQCLFNQTSINKCEVIRHSGNPGYEFKQFCYFCNMYRCMGKKCWIDHMVVHTGYYQFKCVDCHKKFAKKPVSHKAKENHKLEKISQPIFGKKVLQAYVCVLCNFVRFNKCEIETHLCNEHEDEDNIIKTFKEVEFLNFTKQKRIRKIEEQDGAEVRQQEEYESDFEGFEEWEK